MGTVGCSGTEDQLLDCPFQPFPGDCDHLEDAGVVCYGKSPAVLFSYLPYRTSAVLPHRGNVSGNCP